ncbi:RICIN domain-containing protein [Ideonella sp. YS5]|uniref:RICIN domain-containing protein n=1 Tax=Ideonella sp. YS5 TaxID=3453714 RepID=UPI003EED3CE2
MDFKNHSLYRQGINARSRTALAAAGILVSLGAQAANCTDTPQAGRAYYIVNEGSSLVLDVASGSTDNLAKVIQWPSTGQANQQWLAAKVGNAFTFKAMHSNKALDLLNASHDVSAPVGQYDYTGNANQQWLVARPDGGSYTITSVESKKQLAMANKTAGSVLYQRSTDTPSPLKRWYFNPVDGRCGTSSPLAFMGHTKVMIGTNGDGEPVSTPADPNNRKLPAPFEVYYQYLNGMPPLDKNSTCYDSDNSRGGCGPCLYKEHVVKSTWSLCWQELYQPPGGFVTNTTSFAGKEVTWNGQPYPQIMFWDWYQILEMSQSEGSDEILTLNDPVAMSRFFDSFRFFLRKLGTTKAMIHVEPDLWGFVRSVNSDPTKLPAQVATVNPTDCPNQPNTVAGVSRCVIAMVHSYDKNATVGLHASSWNYTQPDDAKRIAEFLRALGAEASDFIVVDPTDRDAGVKQKEGLDTWWVKPTDSAIEVGTRARDFMAWSKSVSESLGKKPIVMWQLPLGNSRGTNTEQHYQDGRIDWLFAHMDLVADSHVVALLFGPGDWQSTSAHTDGDNLFNKTKDYYAKGGVSIR